MNFISTTEASKLWDITPRRVAMLASRGRIPGAVNIENRWFIPSDSKKPSDIRKKSNRMLSQTRFIFPNIVYTICRTHPVEDLDTEEKSLYDAFMFYESGDFESGIAAAVELFNGTKRLDIQIGALFILCYLYIITRQFEEAYSTVFRCFDSCAKVEDHKNEIPLLMHELELNVRNKDWIKNDFSVNPREDYSDFELSYFYLFSIEQDTLNTIANKTIPNMSTHEIAVRSLERNGYSFLSMYCHFYISLLYGSIGDEALERFHMKRSFEIAIDNNAYVSLSGLACFVPDIPYSILEEFSENIREKFVSLMTLNASAYADFISYSGGNTFLSNLSSEDYIYISYCLKNYTLDRIAKLENVSVSKIKKQYVALYKKLGVKGKRELIEAYTSATTSPYPISF